jgi:Arc/MetJ family transcription regulator
MKTTIDIPENELQDAMKFLNAKSKREAVVAALRNFNRKHRMAQLIRFSGTCDFDSNATLEEAELDREQTEVT